jgi:YD repeat-containing protein
VTGGGAVTGVTYPAGSILCNYASFTVSGGGGIGATLTGTVASSGGEVGSCNVTTNGSNYTIAPTCTIVSTDGMGSGATCSVTISGGSVTACTVTANGSGYFHTPQINLTGGNGTGATASVPYTVFPLQSVTVTNGGSGYTSAPTIGWGACIVKSGYTVTISPQTTTTVTDCTICGVSTYGHSRDTSANCTLNAGTTVGDLGAGPTTWAEYCDYGSMANSSACGTMSSVANNRSISHVRSGAPSGITQTTFVDGQARSVQHCSLVDPAVNGGNNQTCNQILYDSVGRVTSQYIPFYVAAAATTAPTAAPAAQQYTQTLYDALDRVTSIQLMKSGAAVLPPTLTAYGMNSTGWVTTVTDANSCQTEVFTDALGHEVQHSVQNNVCSASPTWYSTTMRYDAAGRLLSVTDAVGNVTSFQYDSLGRKTAMSDPDMGAWTYVYDLNGNLTQRTDARGAVMNMSYDAVNRLTVRDLPYLKSGTTWVAGTTGEEDEVSIYDGNPIACHAGTTADPCVAGQYCCNDHCSTTNDVCDSATATCTHTVIAGKTACTQPDQ